MVLGFLLMAAAPLHSTPAFQDDADHDVLCYAFNASEAANARNAGDTENFNQRMQWTMFFRGVSAERYKGAAFNARRDEAIKALGTYLANDGKDLLDSECKARMRVAMNTGS